MSTDLDPMSAPSSDRLDEAGPPPSQIERGVKMLLLTANQFAKRGSEFASGADVAVDESIRDRNRAWAEEQFETAEFFRYLASHLPSLLESQRDGERWRKRFAKLMEACGADISFNIDRDIEAMAKDLRAARVSAPASPPIAPGERP